jgi:hypothetical protein
MMGGWMEIGTKLSIRVKLTIGFHWVLTRRAWMPNDALGTKKPT